MGTTLAIDDDIAVRFAEIRAEDGERFKTLPNRVLRSGLASTHDDARLRRGGGLAVRPLEEAPY